MYEQLVDVMGATLEPPKDDTVAMDIPAGALSQAATVGIQASLNTALYLCDFSLKNPVINCF